jgi:hypothetical protein
VNRVLIPPGLDVARITTLQDFIDRNVMFAIDLGVDAGGDFYVADPYTHEASLSHARVHERYPLTISHEVRSVADGCQARSHCRSKR